MKIYICCSKHHYHRIADIMKILEENGHSLTLPKSYDSPFMEEEMKKKSKNEYISWKAGMLRAQKDKVRKNDAILVLNYEKNGQPNYLGGATFLEIFKAFELGKKIFLMNPLPENTFTDELTAMNPVIINGDLKKIK